MKKDITQRIAYYTKKVVERGANDRSKELPAKFAYRYERLMTYKKIMHQEIANIKHN